MTDRKSATPEVKPPVGTLDLRNQFPPETLRELFVRLGVPPSKEFEPVLDQTYQFAGVEYGPVVGEDGQPVLDVSQALKLACDTIEDLRTQNERLRSACTLALNIMEQTNKVNVPPYARFVTVTFAPEDVAAIRAALEKP